VDASCPECHEHLEPAGAEGGASGSDLNPQPSTLNLSRSDFLHRLFDLILTARNSKFTAGCILIALGHPLADGISMADYARQWGVSRATVSKQCLLICAALHLPPSRFMRDEATRAKFRLSNHRPRKL
jgi:hypothetical protein